MKAKLRFPGKQKPRGFISSTEVPQDEMNLSVYAQLLICVDSLLPMDCSLPGSSVHKLFQATILEWVAISYSITWSFYYHIVFKFTWYYH